MHDSKKNRYKLADGKRWIEVRIKNPLQLFDARDPAPFRERDLDDNFVSYLLTATRELSFSRHLKIVIYIEEPETKELSQILIREAIQSYLAFEIELKKSDLSSFIKRAQIILVVGLLILATCLGVAQNLTIPNPPGALGVLKEGVIIFGWVSIWKPIELILFDWYPLLEKLRFYKKLFNSEFDIRFGSAQKTGF